MLTFNLPLSSYIKLQYSRAQTKIALQHYINLYKIVLDYYTNLHLSAVTPFYVYYCSCLFHCSLLGSSSKVIKHLIVPYIFIVISLKTLITFFFLRVNLCSNATGLKVRFPLSQISYYTVISLEVTLASFLIYFLIIHIKLYSNPHFSFHLYNSYFHLPNCFILILIYIF
jgi:hypothetical protein